MSTEDLIDVYCKFIRSIVEYCSVVSHSALTDAQSKQLENIQTTAMRILLQENFVSPSAAREMTGLQELFEWRESRVETFSRKCLKHPKHKFLFPPNLKNSEMNLRDNEKFKVNFARTSAYQRSGIIKCQQVLNKLAKHGKV